MLLKIALNGARSKSENKFIPQSLDEIVKEVTALNQIGYKTFHIHCYDKHGNESLKPQDVDLLVSCVRQISQNIRIGISSGDWIEPSYRKRVDYSKAWSHIPDFISVNMIEADAVKISQVLIERGISVEAGLNVKDAADVFINSKLRDGICRVLIEPEEEDLAEAIRTVNDIENLLDINKIKIPRLLHGFNAVTWDLLKEAKKRGYDGRIGMEDTLSLEDGNEVKSNIELVNKAREILDAN